MKLHTIFATVLKVFHGSRQFSKVPLETLTLLCLLSPCSILNKPQTYKYPTTALSSRDAAKTVEEGIALISVSYKFSFALSTSSLVVPCGAASDSTMLISILQIRKLRLS